MRSMDRIIIIIIIIIIELVINDDIIIIIIIIIRRWEHSISDNYNRLLPVPKTMNSLPLSLQDPTLTLTPLCSRV